MNAPPNLLQHIADSDPLPRFTSEGPEACFSSWKIAGCVVAVGLGVFFLLWRSAQGNKKQIAKGGPAFSDSEKKRPNLADQYRL